MSNSKWINHVKQWASENGVSYKEALSDKKCSSDYKKDATPIAEANLAHKGTIQEGDCNAKLATGNGFLGDMARKVGNATLGKNATRKIERYGDTVINGRNNLPPKVRTLLQKYGNEIISSASIRRAPVQGAIVGALNAVSLGNFNKELNKGDQNTLYHLQFYFSTQSGKNFVVEKNEVINMDINPSTPAKTESVPVSPMPSNITVQQLMDNTQANMGARMFGFSGKDNNCQDFIMGILDGNKIGDQANRTFTKQDTDHLFNSSSGSNFLRKISNSVTDLGAKVNEITTGAGVAKQRKKK